MRQSTLHTSLIHAAQSGEGRGIRFLTDISDTHLSYYDFFDKALLMLFSLQQQGIKPGDKLILLSELNDAFLDVFWACILGGIIPVPVSAGYQREFLEKLLHIGMKLHQPYLVTHKNIFQNIEKQDAQYKDINFFSGNILRERILFYDELLQDRHRGALHESSPGDIAFIQFSSGSTGEPKGVMLSHENLTANIRAIIKGSGSCQTDCALSWMPLTHDMGLIGFHLTPVMLSCEQILMPPAVFMRNPLLWMEFASRYKATVLSSPNSGYAYFLKRFAKQKNRNWNLGGIRLVFNGAEPISSELIREFLTEMRVFGLKPEVMFPVYGMAEASLAVTFPPPGEGIRVILTDRKLLSECSAAADPKTGEQENIRSFVDLGFPVEECEVRISDGENGNVPENHVGEIEIRGRNVTKGYYNDEQETKNHFSPDGWFRTGDLGFIRDKRLIVTGRKKEIIIIHGANIYPSDVDQAVLRCPYLRNRDIAACGVSDPATREERLALFVRTTAGAKEFIDTWIRLKSYLYEALGLDVAYIIPVPSIPKTTSGKIQRYRLSMMFERGDFSAVLAGLEMQLKLKKSEKKQEAPLNATETRLAEICKKVLCVEDIGVHENMAEFGIDSFTLVQLHREIDEEFRDRLRLSDMMSATTIRSLARIIHGEKEIRMKCLQFPESYFNNTERAYPLSLKTALPAGIPEKIRVLTGKEKLNSFSLYISLYALMLFHVSKNQHIPVYLMRKNRCIREFVCEIFENTTLLNLAQQVEKAVITGNTPVMQVPGVNEKLRTGKKWNTIIPLLYDKKMTDGHHPYFDICDLSLGIEESEKQTGLSMHFNWRRLDREMVKQFFRSYMQLSVYSIETYSQGKTVSPADKKIAQIYN